MTGHEQLMYQIIGKISDLDAPIVFKGALITKLILKENGYMLSERPTNDIDGNWIGDPPTMDELSAIVNKAIESLDYSMFAEPVRTYAPGKSAGIRIVDKETGVRIIIIDVTIKPVIGSRTYHYGELMIRGVIPDAVLCDKISVLSGDRIFRRAKDVLDVFALANCLEIRTSDIYSALEKADRVLGTFEAFLHRRADLEHAYNKMRGIIDKPDFDEVYTFLLKFLAPFISRDMSSKIWCGSEISWSDVIE